MGAYLSSSFSTPLVILESTNELIVLKTSGLIHWELILLMFLIPRVIKSDCIYYSCANTLEIVWFVERPDLGS